MERIFDYFARSPRLQSWIPLCWAILLASSALLDFGGCFPQWVDGWMEGQRKQMTDRRPLHGLFMGNKATVESNGTEFCPAIAIEDGDYNFCAQGRMWLWDHSHLIGVFFCCLCIVESIRRALEGRQIALDMEALNEFEKTLAKVYSATRVNFFWNPTDRMSEEDTLEVVRQFIRVWTPVISNLVGWFIIMPWPMFAYHSFSPRSTWSATKFACGDDPALATLWITQSSRTIYRNVNVWHEEFNAFLWKIALPVLLPVQLWVKPLKLIQRFRLISRWIRYFRYAGPLVRLLLKLQDQFRVFDKIWRQTWTASTEKAKRLASRSMLFHDIQRLESLTKLQTRLASLPSHFSFGSRKEISMPTISVSTNISSSMQESPSPDLFVIPSVDEDDPDLDDSPHPPNTPHRGNESGINGPNRVSCRNLGPSPSRPNVAILIAKKQIESRRMKSRLDHLKRHFFASTRQTSELYDRMVELTREATRQVHSAVWNKHLISPQTRFSVGWRLIVTFALLSELGRLLISYQLSRTFDLRYRDLTIRLLGMCQAKSRPVRNWIGKVVKLPASHPWLDTCRSSSPSSRFSLLVAEWSEVIIDCVGFLDIVVWFYTGELDVTGILVVPKPFFTRCILPGTLIQILDHPTVPKAIPHYISCFFQAAGTVGYSRVWRWALAIYPAIHLLLMAPVQRYLFAPMEKDEYLNYTESLLQFRSTFASRASLTRPGTNRSLLVMEGHAGSHHHQHQHHHYDDSERDDNEDDENCRTTRQSFLPGAAARNCGPSHGANGSYTNLLHASISENDGYGLFYY